MHQVQSDVSLSIHFVCHAIIIISRTCILHNYPVGVHQRLSLDWVRTYQIIAFVTPDLAIGHVHMKSNTSHVMGHLLFTYICENKDADQLH